MPAMRSPHATRRPVRLSQSRPFASFRPIVDLDYQLRASDEIMALCDELVLPATAAYQDRMRRQRSRTRSFKSLRGPPGIPAANTNPSSRDPNAPRGQCIPHAPVATPKPVIAPARGRAAQDDERLRRRPAPGRGGDGSDRLHVGRPRCPDSPAVRALTWHHPGQQSPAWAVIAS
jgi:hypothetical protein